MNFLILSTDYTGIVLYKRLQQEQHNVWLLNPTHRNNGISTISSVWVCIRNNIDLAIFCNPGFNNEYNIITQKKIPTFGGTEFQEKLETDQDTLRKFCKQLNIRFLKDQTKKAYPLSTEVWFSNGEPIYQYFNYIKQYKFLAGDLGLDVDGESVVFWSNLDRQVESVKRIFENGLFEFLSAIKYTGVLAVDSYISQDDKYPYVFKVIPRMQAPVLAAMLELYNDNFGNFLMNLVQGKIPSIILQDKISIAVAVSESPYPIDRSFLLKYVVASDTDWKVARKNIGKELRDLSIDKPQIQYRIDGGMQASFISYNS